MLGSPPSSTDAALGASGFDMPRAAFNEVGFVTWWLGTLYLFPVAEQVAIAGLLRNAVHVPEVQREIDAFIEFHLPTDPEGAEEPEVVSAAGGRTGFALVAKNLVELWRANPWPVSLGVLAILFMVAKGLWFVATEFFRLVF